MGAKSSDDPAVFSLKSPGYEVFWISAGFGLRCSYFGTGPCILGLYFFFFFLIYGAFFFRSKKGYDFLFVKVMVDSGKKENTELYLS